MVHGRKREHITPALKNLHWLPISQHIYYKLSLLCYRSFNFLLPSYFSDLLSPYSVLYKWYNQTLCSMIAARALLQACFFQICTFCLELTASWSLWNKHHKLFPNSPQNLPFPLLLDLVPSLNKLNWVVSIVWSGPSAVVNGWFLFLFLF